MLQQKINIRIFIVCSIMTYIADNCMLNKRNMNQIKAEETQLRKMTSTVVEVELDTHS